MTLPRRMLPRFERGRIGERYLIGGQNVTLADLWPRSPAMSGASRRGCACRGRS